MSTPDNAGSRPVVEPASDITRLDSKAICVRVSLAEYADMQTCAASHGITVPELLRRGYYLFQIQELARA